MADSGFGKPQMAALGIWFFVPCAVGLEPCVYPLSRCGGGVKKKFVIFVASCEKQKTCPNVGVNLNCSEATISATHLRARNRPIYPFVLHGPKKIESK
jgi:hypothetical protein